MEPSVSGQGGHLALFRAACVLVHKFELSDDVALELLRMFNGRCSPPWALRDLVHKIREARMKARGYAQCEVLA
jgi:hypothetical protein